MATNNQSGSTQNDDRGREHESAIPSERSPLLPREESNSIDQSQPYRETSAHDLLSSIQNGKTGKRRWPSILALAILCLVVVVIIVFAFVAPSVVEQYAQQAVHFEPTSLSIDSFTTTGVRARIEGDFTMDAQRVEKKAVRDIGVFCTWIARSAESGESNVEVSLPEYGNMILGNAVVPGIKVDLRNGHTTHVSFLSDLTPGNVDGIRSLANDWIDGRLGRLRVRGKAEVPVKSGILSLGRQMVQQELTFANNDIPTIPTYQIKRLNIHEFDRDGEKGMAADISLLVDNDYPVDFALPSLGFNILVDNCQKHDPYIKLADAVTQVVHIHPKKQVLFNATGLVHSLPDVLTQDCPGSHKSPLDLILGRYMAGQENTVYVQGAASPSEITPQWIVDLISDITIPVPLPGKSMGHLIRNFSLEDTHFSFPDPFAQPNTPKANPRISAIVRALIALPEEMNFNLSVSRVRADGDVFYKGKKLGYLDLHKWQDASSHRVESSNGDGPLLMVESKVHEAPLWITDDNVLTDVIQELIFGGKEVVMEIKANVDVKVDTALGELAIRQIPAQAISRTRPDGHDGAFASMFRLSVSDLQILGTTESSLSFSALINITNPTQYTANIPYVDLHILSNNSLIAHATTRDLLIAPGNNTNILVQAVYDPISLSGEPARAAGRELLSRYLSGYNTTLTMKLHSGSIPALPDLGKALSRFSIEVPTPRLGPGGGSGGKGGKQTFIEDATMHLFSSTADFTLFSPLKWEVLYVTSINATAYSPPSDPEEPDFPSDPDDDGDDDDDDENRQHSLHQRRPIDSPHDPSDPSDLGDKVGHIFYDSPFAVPPVDSGGNGVTTPRLPVEWSLGGVGYDAVKRALGGTLKLGAFAQVGVRIGSWQEEKPGKAIWRPYHSGPVGVRRALAIEDMI
nr:hypothetical protein CFP56_16623 [Quercus suber]